MSRLIYFFMLLFAFIWSASAQVSTINTPAGPVAIGATITITWVYTPQTNPIQGILSIVDSTTQNTVIISSTITLSTQSFQWTVNVPAGTYYLALNDGSGNKDTGTFTVFTPGGTTSNSTAPAPATSGAAAPAAPKAPAAPSALPTATAAPKAPAAPSALPTATAAPASSPVSSKAPPSTTPAQPTSSPEQSSSSNVGIYIGIAVGGIVIGAILSFVGYRVYKKHQDSNFIPTPSSADLK
ncbi:5026_t:CDS:2 [Dentiscutata erythropus]|uniref:5026_t:CDS:1 n=1 Tax=Dentiscutata erythropus TaxID=1348616 RepID=A0A9N9NT95_9GLOM|nr:5026_t:CDS:2 [Dentiscutata erythropus]